MFVLFTEFVLKFSEKCDASKHHICCSNCSSPPHEVCGYNGKDYRTFSNECALEAYNCDQKETQLSSIFLLTAKGKCAT